MVALSEANPRVSLRVFALVVVVTIFGFQIHSGYVFLSTQSQHAFHTTELKTHSWASVDELPA